MNYTITELEELGEQDVIIELRYQPLYGDPNSIELVGTMLGINKTQTGIYFLPTEQSAFDAESEGVELEDSIHVKDIQNISIKR